MKDILEKVKKPFEKELITEGDIWRILRKGTLVDLIILSFFNFQNDRQEIHLIDIFNYSVKIKLLSRIKAIEVKGTLDEVSKKFNRETELILTQYDTIYSELKPTFNNYTSTNLYDLNGKIQYIKVINEIENDSYTDDVFEGIMGITYNLLLNE